MIRIYGSHLCPDCRKTIDGLKKENITFEFLDISQDLSYLKEFLALRDHQDVYQTVKENGGIGIPCFVFEDGTVSLEYKKK